MIRKNANGYTVFARSGRKMGTYRTIDQAQVRLGQLEAFKAQRSPLGRMSPTVRAKSKDGRKGYYVRAKSGRSMGWYPTKAEALRRKGQLEANGAKFFKETRGYTRHQGSPSPWKRSVPNRADLIAALGLEPEGRTRGQKYAFTTAEFWKKIRTHHSEAARNARRVFGLPELGAHSWPGQPRRHARAAKRGHRRHARRYSHSPIATTSWGVLPPYQTFVRNLSRIDEDEGRPYLNGNYPIEAHSGSADDRLLRRMGKTPSGVGGHGRNLYLFPPKQLYTLLKRLSRMDPDAGEGLASSIMGTLGYEWI